MSTTLPAEKIVTCPLHRRSNWGDMDDLARSIARHGLIQPLVVRNVGDVYETIAGERRRRSCEVAGLKEIPVVVRVLTDDQVLDWQLEENRGREALHPLDEADLYRELTERGRSVESIAEVQGVAVKYVRARLKLCGLPDGARQAYLDGKLSDFAAFAVSRVYTAERKDQAVEAILREQKRGPMLSDAQVTDLLRRGWFLSLAHAPWSLSQVVGDVEPCKVCPKRTVPQRDLFDDFYEAGGVASSKKDDYCTDPACWEVKSDLHWKEESQQHETAGGTVLKKRESAGIWKEWAAVGEKRALLPNGAWVEADDLAEDGGGKTWREVAAEAAGGKSETPEVLVRDPDGFPRWLYEAKQARALARKAAKATRAAHREVLGQDAPSSDLAKVERAASRKARREAEVVMTALARAAAEVAPQGSTSKLIAVLAGVAVAALPDAATRVAKRYTVDAETLLMNARNSGVAALAALLTEVLLDEAADLSDEVSPVVTKACADIGVDVDAVTARAKDGGSS